MAIRTYVRTYTCTTGTHVRTYHGTYVPWYTCTMVRTIWYGHTMVYVYYVRTYVHVYQWYVLEYVHVYVPYGTIFGTMVSVWPYQVLP
jgi:hypothetical protein